MAKAFKETTTNNKRVVIKPEVIIPAVFKDVTEEVTTVTLKLTQAEAEFLQVALAYVSGNTLKSPRKYAIRILNALHNAGVAFEPGHYETDALLGIKGSVYFKDYPKVPKGKLAAPHVPSVTGVVPKEPEKAVGGCVGLKAAISWPFPTIPAKLPEVSRAVIVSSPYGSKGIRKGEVVDIISTTEGTPLRGDWVAKGPTFNVGFTSDELQFLAS